MVTSIILFRYSPIEPRTKATPPAFGFKRCVKVLDFCRAFLCGVNRVPSTKFIMETGVCLNFSHAFFVLSRSLPFKWGFASI